MKVGIGLGGFRGRLLTLLAPVVCSCAGGEEYPAPPVPPPPPSAIAPAPSAADPSAPPATILDNPLFSIAARDPEAEVYYRAHLDAAPKPLVAQQGGTVTHTAVLSTSRVEARDVGDAPVFHGQRLEEGERGRLTLDVAAPECFTVVVHGSIGVAEVDAFVVDGPDGSPRILGHDSKSGPMAVVGGRGGCPEGDDRCGPICVEKSTTARVEVIVRKGAGNVVLGLSRMKR